MSSRETRPTLAAIASTMPIACATVSAYSSLRLYGRSRGPLYHVIRSSHGGRRCEKSVRPSSSPSATELRCWPTALRVSPSSFAYSGSDDGRVALGGIISRECRSTRSCAR